MIVKCSHFGTISFYKLLTNFNIMQIITKGASNMTGLLTRRPPTGLALCIVMILLLLCIGVILRVVLPFVAGIAVHQYRQPGKYR